VMRMNHLEPPRPEVGEQAGSHAEQRGASHAEQSGGSPAEQGAGSPAEQQREGSPAEQHEGTPAERREGSLAKLPDGPAATSATKHERHAAMARQLDSVGTGPATVTPQLPHQQRLARSQDAAEARDLPNPTAA